MHVNIRIKVIMIRFDLKIQVMASHLGRNAKRGGMPPRVKIWIKLKAQKIKMITEVKIKYVNK